jgi:hypothetical protein
MPTADPAVVIVPGDGLDREDTIAAMDASPGWNEFAIEHERLLRPAAAPTAPGSFSPHQQTPIG